MMTAKWPCSIAAAAAEERESGSRREFFANGELADASLAINEDEFHRRNYASTGRRSQRTMASDRVMPWLNFCSWAVSRRQEGTPCGLH